MKNLTEQHRKYILLAAFLLAAALFVSAGYKINQAKTKADIIPVASSPLEQTNVIKAKIVRSGVVINSTLVPVNSDYSGRISDIYVKEGQTVQAGQQLFRLEPSAEAAQAEAAAAPTTASPPVGKDYENAIKDLSRFQKLYEQGVISKRELDNLAAKIQAPRSGPDNKPAAVAPVLQAPVTIKASIDGVVTGLAVTSGGLVRSGQEVMSLGSGQSLSVAVPLSQEELNLVSLGTPAVIEVSGNIIKGQVASVYPEVIDNKLSSFQCIIKLAPFPPELLNPAMTVLVGIGVE